MFGFAGSKRQINYQWMSWRLCVHSSSVALNSFAAIRCDQLIRRSVSYKSSGCDSLSFHVIITGMIIRPNYWRYQINCDVSLIFDQSVSSCSSRSILDQKLLYSSAIGSKWVLVIRKTCFMAFWWVSIGIVMTYVPPALDHKLISPGTLIAFNVQPHASSDIKRSRRWSNDISDQSRRISGAPVVIRGDQIKPFIDRRLSAACWSVCRWGLAIHLIKTGGCH